MTESQAGAPGLIDRYFTWRRVRAQLRTGLLAPYWDELIGSLADAGYSSRTIRRIVQIAEPFAAYAVARGIREASGLTEELVDQHLDGRVRRGSLVRRERAKARGMLVRVLAFLRDRGVVAAVPPPPPAPYAPLLDEYLAFLRDHRGILAASTIDYHRATAAALLQSLGEGAIHRVADLTAADVYRFVSDRAPALTRSARKTLCSATRSLLRFLFLRRHLGRNLVEAVPVIPTFKLDRLPRGLPWDDVCRTVRGVDRSTPKGRRDYAMLLLLATYGIRIGQLRTLRLEDIDWRHDKLHVRAAKGGLDVSLPLRPAVGEAIVDYLRHGRPASPHREIFLRVRAPYRPLRSNMYAMIERHARKAGVRAAIVGAHNWRHATATRMVEQGQPLKTVREVLGHRHVESSFLYTKVDVEKLRQAALEWPEVSP